MSTRQLLDDCFLHDRDRLRHDAAVAILRDKLGPVVSTERIALDAALGRVVARPITAPRPVPARDNSAVDGWAFAHDGYLASNGRFVIGARIAAGHPADTALPQGHAARIFTGAVMPDGADTVAMQEDCAISDDGGLIVPPGLKPGANRRRAGEDLAAGTELVAPGRRLGPADIAAIASTGAAGLDVFARLEVALFSTGDEIAEPGAPLADGQVYDANRPLLAALTSNLPVALTQGGLLRDDADLVRARLKDAANRHDVILTTGGASRGDADHLITTLDALGTRHVWQLAIKPGRPMTFGRIGDCAVFGLPGNPVAAFVCFLLYVRPALVTLAGGSWETPRRYPLPAGFRMSKKPDRREFLRGIVRVTEHGPVIDKFARDGSGLITGLREADGLIEIPEEVTAIEDGQPLSFIPFGEFGLG